MAAGLKKAVAAVLDFLASTIDSLLKLVQDIYNGILTVVGMLVSGELAEIMAKLGNLVAAAQTAPGQFETAAYEELLGGNLDEPLSPAELIAAGRTPPRALPAGAETPGGEEMTASSETGGEEELTPRAPWTEDNVGVEHVASGVELSPELSKELMSRAGEDGEIAFGESDDNTRSIEGILGLAPAGQSEQGVDPEAVQGQQQTQQGPAPADGLTPAERAQIKWTLMKQGLAKWWSDNWPYVIGGGILAVAGFIVANILTGGAILAALPPLMTAIGYLFTGMMVLQLAGHLRDFLQKGWAGSDPKGAGKSLAKGLAAGAIEVISWLTFKVGSVAMKGAKAAGRGIVRGAQAAGRAGARMVRGAVRLARRGVNYVLKGGKVLLRGVGDAIERGVKRLGELAERLLQRTRFKGFRIRLAGRRWRLEGKINPWVLLASGRIVEVDALPENARIGDLVDDVVDGQRGRVVATGVEPPNAADVARVLGEAPGSPLKVQRTLDRLDRAAERIAELESKQAGRGLSLQERQELQKLRLKLEEPLPLSESSAFTGARNDSTRLMPLDANVPPRQLPYLEQAQELMNELNKASATFGDGSVAMSILGEQIAGGQTARALIGDTLHLGKGLDSLQPLYRLAQSGNLPGPAARRLLEEARKIEEAVAWASKYRRAIAAGTATLDGLPTWAQKYRELFETLLPH